jgi:signal transduction histidine kinase
MKGGLRTRIVVLLAIATIVPTVLVGALAVRRARTDVRREVVRGHLALVRALGAGLDTTLQDLRHALALAAGAWADNPAPDATKRQLQRIRRELPSVRKVAVLDADGALVAGDALPEAAFERANTYGGYVSDVIRPKDGGPPSALVVVQARTRTGELAGYVAAEIDLSFVGDTLAAARAGAGSRLWVVDGAGEPVGWSGVVREAARGGPTRVVVERALASGGEGSLEAGGSLAVYANLSSYQTVKGVSWAIVLEQPTSKAYALAAATTRDTILVGAAVLFVALLAGLIFASRLTRPLARLSRRVEEIAEGTGGAPHGSAGRGGGEGSQPPFEDEIGALARRFEDMARRVAEREKLKEALARNQQLASVGALAAGVAHEINNPLTTILGYANLLLEDKPPGHADRESLELVADEARRVQGIVRTLLDHARAETGPVRRDPVDVNALCERTVALVGPTLKKRGIALALDLGDGLANPLGDARRLEQVLVNLAQNAVQAMDKGGSLRLATAPRDGRVEVAIADTGPGIPEELLGKIFDPFFTTKGPGVGTGLGLAIAQQIVLDHGGTIEVESKVGRGSTFKVLL